MRVVDHLEQDGNEEAKGTLVGLGKRGAEGGEAEGDVGRGVLKGGRRDKEEVGKDGIEEAPKRGRPLASEEVVLDGLLNFCWTRCETRPEEPLRGCRMRGQAGAEGNAEKGSSLASAHCKLHSTT